MSHEELTEVELRRLLDAGRSLVSELHFENMLEKLLEAARDLTGARYAALGVLDSSRTKVQDFLTLGIDEATRTEIGELPQGLGVLGEVVRNPQPLRLARVGDHPHSVGFPPGHPPMETFLGVPIKIRGEAFGNIYLTEKSGAREFDGRDESMLTVLAEWAAVAIDNARLYQECGTRRGELERAVKALEATVSLTRVGAAGTDLGFLMNLIVEEGRDLVESRSLLMLSTDSGHGLVVSALSGEVSHELIGQSVPAGNPLLESARLDARVHHVASSGLELGGAEKLADKSTMIVHLVHRGHNLGYLIAIDPETQVDFSADDELLFQSFAGSAAISLATARDIERDRLRMSIKASEQERRRWAMELHDETLQDLGALKVIHESALSLGDPETMRRSLESATVLLGETIDSLESLIQELRPASLDALGLAAAIETLVERTSNRGGLMASTHIDLARERGETEARLDPQLEATIYRVVQEALNNSVKHADAGKVAVSITESEGEITVFIEDDGVGFVPAEGFGDRFGLHGMNERVGLVDGELEIDSAPGNGTRVEVHIPSSGRAARR